MSTFTLAISCLTTSNLPWFMDLTFQVPMQYCSLQHQTLLPSPVTSTTGHCFCFGSILSFFLELVLHWSPVAYWAPTDLGSSSFSILSFCLFILFMGFRYDLNQIPYDYTVEMRNRFKGLDLIDRMPEELWTEGRDIVQEAEIKTITKKKKCEKAKWLSEEALQ